MRALESRPWLGLWLIAWSAIAAISQAANITSPRRHSAGRTTALPLFNPSTTVLFVGAHPDDEVLLAPLLGKACIDDGARCSLLIATRGEAGGCSLPQGCGADLGATRAEEMQRAAAIFGASLIQWTLEDAMAGGPSGVRAVWSEQSGGNDALLAKLRDAIDAVRPTVILTFDPEHGSSCHPAHRAMAGLVLDAVERLSIPRPVLFLLETAYRYDEVSASFTFQSAVTPRTPIAIFDANTFLPSVNDVAWRYVLMETTAHASQFSDAQRHSLAMQPEEQRRIFLIPARQSFIEYASTCP